MSGEILNTGQQSGMVKIAASSGLQGGKHLVHQGNDDLIAGLDDLTRSTSPHVYNRLAQRLEDGHAAPELRSHDILERR